MRNAEPGNPHHALRCKPQQRRVFVQHADITPSGRYLDSVAGHLARKANVDKAAWLGGVPVEWEDLSFAAVAVCSSNLHGPFLWGSCRYRPDLDSAGRAHLEPVLSALGLSATQRAQ
jgi:hypothetical protein